MQKEKSISMRIKNNQSQNLQQKQFEPHKYNKQYFKIQLQQPLTIQKLLTNQCTNILTPSFRKLYKKDFNKILFVIKINHGNQQWKFENILDCIKHYNNFINFNMIQKKNLSNKYRQYQQENKVKSRKKIYYFQLNFSIFFLKKSQMQHSMINNFKYSLISFLSNLVILFILFSLKGSGIIYSQVQLQKHSGGRYNEATCFKKIQNTCFRNWRNRWFTVTDQGVFYTVKKRTYIIKQMLNFSQNFKIYCGMQQTGKDLGIQIKSAYRLLELKANKLIDFAIFVVTLKKSYQKSPHKNIHRYHSFSSIKEHCSTQFFIDGEDYFESVRKQLTTAKKYVYITDWMLTPFIQLKRPSSLDDRSSRFDYILEDLAKKGVKIYIILFMEPKIALNNDSQFVQTYFQKMNKNIKVLRHPNYILIPFLWSHHEKIIVIDQRVGFLGGLDICYGRWDTQKHPLTDSPVQSKQLFKGADFCNFRISDIYTPRNFQISNIDKKCQSRMPWHDICVKIIGGSVHDLARHFIQYWNFVNFQTNFDQRQLLMHSGLNHNNQKNQKILKPTKAWMHASFSQFVKNVKDVITHSKAKKLPDLTKDFQIQKDFKQQQPQLQQSQSQNTQRTFAGNQLENKMQHNLSPPAQNILKDQFQYYEHYLQQEKNNNKKLPNIQIPIVKDITNYSKKLEQKLKNIFDRNLNQKNSDSRLMITHEQTIQQTYKSKRGNSKHQILRSASTWSLGLEDSIPQSSIHQAYIDLIKKSKHYIYIQNQFFISLQNKVCSALVQRINKAFIYKQNFKVIIMMPLLPGFQGDITNQTSSSVMRVQLHWEYRTLCRSKNSLYQRLSHIPCIDDYLKVYSLRQHGITQDGIPVTEQIYIHSKLMIVDDQKVIIGSANINDRSLLGDRDSQIAVLIEPETQELKKDSNGYYYYEYAKKLRIQLYKQHFGFSDNQCFNFHNQVVWKQIKINSKNNTQIYRNIFGCYPDDNIKTISDVSKMKVQKPSKQQYLSESKHIKGHVVDFPLKFLQKQNLNLKINQREFFIPFINFT